MIMMVLKSEAKITLNGIKRVTEAAFLHFLSLRMFFDANHLLQGCGSTKDQKTISPY